MIVVDGIKISKKDATKLAKEMDAKQMARFRAFQSKYFKLKEVGNDSEAEQLKKEYLASEQI